MKRRPPLAWGLAVLLWLVAGAAPAAAPPPLTLEQAVARVQQDTGGTVLSAEPRKLGRRTQYRIKVLTPQGHVQVIVVASDATGNPPSTPATKNPGTKEKH